MAISKTGATFSQTVAVSPVENRHLKIHVVDLNAATSTWLIALDGFQTTKGQGRVGPRTTTNSH